MHFEENQLSPSLFGLSPLSTAHHRHFQLTCVRPSTGSYPRFSLAMDRSLGFGSIACDSKRPVQTRFRFGSPSRVNLATYHNSQAHSSKGTPSWPPEGDDTLTACKPTVSGTISLPSRGAFHLSLTVLVHYRSPRNT